jgi:hypothetical protein
MTYDQIMKAVDIPMYEEWSGVSVRNEPTHVLRAYEEAGGQRNEPRPLLTRRRFAAMVAVLVVSLGAIAAVRMRRRRPAA